MSGIKKQVNNHFLCLPASEQKETGIPRMEDYVVKALANSRSMEVTVEITMELLGSRLDVFQNICQPRMVWICLSQQRSAWIIALLLFSLHLFISPYFSSAWKMRGQWELQRNLYFAFFFLFPSGKPLESMKTHSYVFPQN